MVFTEGEEEKSIRAAFSFLNSGYGTPILVGREERVHKIMEELGLENAEGVELTNAKLNPAINDYTEFLYRRIQRKGHLLRDCDRMVKRDRNVFAACMVAAGDADAMVTGLTRDYHVALTEITRVLDPNPNSIVFGLSLVLARDRTFFVADTAVHESPSPVELADIAQQTADVARQMGHEPRVALLSSANFRQPELSRAKTVRQAVEELDERGVNFEYDGEMGVDVAINSELMANYPFCRLTGPANILVMPGLHSAQISSKLLHELGDSTVVGPLLIGLSKPAQIVPMGATTSDMVTMAVLAAHGAS